MTCGIRHFVVTISLLWTSTANGAVAHVPVKSGVVLKPDEAYTVAIDTTEPVEIGWKAVQAKPCTTKCVQATDLGSAFKYSIATPLGASQKYEPVSGRITIEYKNVSGEPVTIDVYRVERTCDAEACAFLDAGDNADWLVFKVDEFKSIATSKDGSYSVITGVTMTGRPLSFKAVWWTDDKKALGVNCARFVQRYLDSHTPKDQYRPYIISGHAVRHAPGIVLKSIDTCVPKAPNYGVPEKNVYK